MERRRPTPIMVPFNEELSKYCRKLPTDRYILVKIINENDELYNEEGFVVGPTGCRLRIQLCSADYPMTVVTRAPKNVKMLTTNEDNG